MLYYGLLLLQISHKFALVSPVYLLENEFLVLSRGEAFAPYSKAQTNAGQMSRVGAGGGGRGRLQLTEP